jgi:integrating conjugative element protein (TIGR03755 family)
MTFKNLLWVLRVTVKLLLMLVLVLMLTFIAKSYATEGLGSQSVIPSNKESLLYYQLGGGRDFVLPPVKSTERLDLNAKANLGAGYHCGVFNPAMSLQHSLNQQVQRLKQLKMRIVQNATSAIGHYPMYLLAKANPSLYNAVNNQLLEAENHVALSMKTCEELKQATALGMNPYHEWAQLSVNNAWKKELSLAASTGKESVTAAKDKVNTQSHTQGVPWMQGKLDNESGLMMAGGEGQPPVAVIADTVRAGYNLLLGRKDNPNDHTPPQANAENQHLLTYWPTPLSASQWVVGIIGDTQIRTCHSANCNQSTISGRGLTPYLYLCSNDDDLQENLHCAENIKRQLVTLSNTLASTSTITQQQLNSLSSHSLAISPSVLQALNTLAPTEKSIVIEKLAYEIAAQKLIDKALTARRLLITGSQLPIIASNLPAQKRITQGIQQLDQEMQQLLFEQQLRKQIASPTLTKLLQHHQMQLLDSMSNTQPGIEVTGIMENGAIIAH